MKRTTLREYEELFTSNVMHQTTAIRGMEQLGEWEAAEKHWFKIGDKENADACNLLKVAIEKGNDYRAEVRPIMNWVEETVESGIMTEAEALKIAYPKMQEVHNRIYKKE